MTPIPVGLSRRLNRSVGSAMIPAEERTVGRGGGGGGGARGGMAGFSGSFPRAGGGGGFAGRGAMPGFSGAFPRAGAGASLMSGMGGRTPGTVQPGPRSPGRVQRLKPNIQNWSNNWWGQYPWWWNNSGYWGWPWWGSYGYYGYPYYNTYYYYPVETETEEDPPELLEVFLEEEITPRRTRRYCRRVVDPFCDRNPNRQFCRRYRTICDEAFDAED